MEEKILYVFDMDDTLVKMPDVSEIFDIKNGMLHCGDHTIDGAIEKMVDLCLKAFKETNEEKIRAQELAGIEHTITFKKIGKYYEGECILMLFDGEIVDANFLQKIQSSPNLIDKEKNKILEKFDLCDGKVAIGYFSEIFQTESTVGTSVNDQIADIYRKVENKMIVTGRNKQIQKGTEKVLFSELGANLPEPKYGLHLFPGGNIEGGIKGFKANVVADSVAEHGWTRVVYFDDRGDWLSHVKQFVEEKFPNTTVSTKLIKSLKK